jgi:anti-sigma-K factor RskA
MIPENRDDLYALAGEYVLGTAEASALREIEAALATNGELRRAVSFWEDQFHPLSRLTAPADPPASTWAAIERRIGTTRRTEPPPRIWRSVAFWRCTTAGVAALAASLALYIAVAPSVPAPSVVAVLHAPQQDAARWVATAGRYGLFVRSVAPNAPPQGRSFELWVIVPGTVHPRSLGVIPSDGVLRLRTAPADLREGATLAISVEPVGGSPTAQPTGPVVFVGPIQAM